MAAKRMFRQVTFDRKYNVKQLKAILSRTMRGLMKDTSPEAVPVRLESILVENNKTTVFLSGNNPGLNAVSDSLRRNFSTVKVSKASRNLATRPPRASASSPRAN